MTDELVKRLRAVDHMSLEDCFCQSSLYDQAADRIEQLTAELADAEALIESQAKDHASNNIRFAEAEHRAKAAEAERDHAWAMVEKADTQMGQSLADHLQAKAERDRLRAALIELVQQTHNCERELTEDLHHVDFCGESVPLTNAREALKGGGHE